VTIGVDRMWKKLPPNIRCTRPRYRARKSAVKRAS